MTGLKIGSPSRCVHFLGLHGRLSLVLTLVSVCLVLNTVGADAQTGDDHGNTFGSATPLSLGSSIAGRIDPGNDVDVFKLDLSGKSGNTDVWIYTTGELDTAGGLYDVDPRNPLLWNDDSFISGRRLNFHLRATLAPGTYYVGVFSFDRLTTGDYVLHAEAVIDPGNAISSAKSLNLSTPTAGTISFAGDADYFRLDLNQDTHLFLYARSVYGQRIFGYPVDSSDRFSHLNTHFAGNIFLVRDQFGPGTHYIRVFTLGSTASHPVPYTIHAFKESTYPDFLENCQAATSALNNPLINDPLYGCQWHLRNQTGEDINVEPVWVDGINGEGVNIAVVDDGMDFSHIDLRDNVSTSLNHNYADTEGIFNPFAHHGTYVAGVVGARDNSIGVRGVAPRATVYGYNYLVSDRTDAQRSHAMTHNATVTAVSNNSWGPVEGPGLGGASVFWERAVNSGINSGYDGKGTLYTWAAGNGHLLGDDANLDELANYFGVTAVCSVNDGDTRASYSEMGANLWVCAPSGDRALSQSREIVTTENYDRYVYDFSGTSAATPIVSGVAALMRQANPNLTWRDLKLILAASARKNDPTNAGWKDGARKYGSTSATDLYHFNHEYGFGVVDAKAAVDMAKGWTGNLPAMQTSSAASGSFNFHVPDLPASLIPTTHYHDLTLTTDIDFIEFVEVNVTFNHPSFRDLDIELVSPSGAVSKLTVPFDTYTPDDPTDDDFILLNGSFRFGSARHLGENPNGVWRLNVSDRIELGSGIWDSWSIKVYGHSGVPASAGQCATGGAVANAPSNPGLVSDCDTLLEARDTLVGTGTSLNWSASMPMSAWDGVAVGGTPARVTEMSLQNKGLRGTVPPQLGSLTELRALRLSTTPEVCQANVCRETLEQEQNQLTGPIPPALGSLSKLESLTIGRNQLTGPIPIELRNLNNLSLLAFGGNQLAGPVPTWLGDLTNLTEVYLWGNEFTGQIPTELANLTNLTQLELARNQLSGGIPAELGNLPNLIVLTLWNNQLSGAIPPQLGNLSELETLSVSQNQLSGAIPIELGSLSTLKVLSLWSNQFSGPIPAQLGNLSSLERLSLSQNQLSGALPTELGNLSNLRELSLWSNQLTGVIPPSFVNLTSLETLYLSRNQFVGCIPAGLQNVPTNDLADVSLPFCVQPSVTLSKSSPDAPIRLNSVIQVTATFSEPVTGFEMVDVVVANSIVSGFVGADGDSVFTFDVTPNAIGVVTVDIPQDAAVDSESNGNTAAAQLRLGMPYDDDNDGFINGIEVLNGVRDYFLGILSGQQVLELVRLYFSSPG